MKDQNNLQKPITPLETLKKLNQRFFLNWTRLPLYSGIYFSVLILFVFAAGLFSPGKQEQQMPQIYEQAPAALIALNERFVIKIKGPNHRQIVFCQNNQTLDHVCKRDEAMAITSLETFEANLTGHPLEFGDIDQSGSVGVNDWSAVVACRNANANKGDANWKGSNCNKTDANLDGQVNNFDIDLLYKTLSTKPDDE